jgi:hypothetical protein
MSANRAALQLVEMAPFAEQVAVRADDSSSHALHQLFPSGSGVVPEAAKFCIERFSKPGELVLNPFTGLGTIALEVVLRGRRLAAIDSDPLAVQVTRARLTPADLGEVAFSLQVTNLKRPVDLSIYREDFSAYYDVETFRELMNLKQALQGRSDRISRFVQVLTQAVMHGHTASHCSVYTSPRYAVLPAAQSQLNRKRDQTADYRPVAPRILKRAAQVLQDGVPSALLSSNASASEVQVCDVRNLPSTLGGQAALVMGVLPQPYSGGASELDSWLRRWFSGFPVQASSVWEEWPNSAAGVEQWGGFVNESLLEFARVVRGGGRLALLLDKGDPSKRAEMIGANLVRIATQELGKFWGFEGQVSFSSSREDATSAGSRRSGDLSQCELYVFRRR